jgi:LPS O-antigen subunit length determinant protein (WzzB/FepE family)
MEEFKLTAKVTISVYTKVKADSIEEAIKIAEEREIEESDYQGQKQHECWVSDEYDGIVTNIEEE